MADPQLVGCYDDDGVARCRATGKRCLSRRQAVEKARTATRKGRERSDPRPITEYHCRSCDCWHYGHAPGRVEKPSRRRVRRKPRTPRRRGW